LCNILITHFSTSILVKKSSTELFFITQLEGEITRAYLKRFNEKMLKVENLLELMVIEALINGIHNYFLWKCLMHYLIKVFSIWNKLWKSYLCGRSKCITTKVAKMNLDHHDGLSDPIEYVQNTRFILSMCLHYQFPPIWYL